MNIEEKAVEFSTKHAHATGGQMHCDSNTDDTHLIKQTRTGNYGAYNLFFNRHKKPICAFCYRILENDDDAQDATVETFCKHYVWIQRPEWQQAAIPTSGLYFIARHVCIDMLRRKKGVTLASLEALAAEGVEFAGSDTNASVALVGSDDVTGAVGYILSLLEEEDREVLVLKYRDGYTAREMADILGISVSDVNTRLNRARKRFATKAWEMLPEWAAREADARRQHGNKK